MTHCAWESDGRECYCARCYEREARRVEYEEVERDAYCRACEVDYLVRVIFGGEDRALDLQDLARFGDDPFAFRSLVSGPWIRFGVATYRIKLAALRATGEVEQ